jgi:uncharacterized protein
VSEAASGSDRFLAGRHAVDSFGQGGFRFGGMSHRGGILCLPSGVRAWPAPSPFRHDGTLYSGALAEAGAIDLLLIGCGGFPLPLPQELRQRFREAGIGVDTLTTAAAAGTYNVLMAEGRRVAAALAPMP